MNRRLYYTKLDSLRFFAFLLVIWQHVFFNFFLNLSNNKSTIELISIFFKTGGIGVHIFFVISGFLITYLLIQEEKVCKRINITYFYIRRFLRIWTLYYLVLGLGIFILPQVFSAFKFEGNIMKNLFFLNNFDNISVQVPNIGIAWSVAIEEQFYLFWPIVFYFVKNKKLLGFFIIICFLLSVLFAFYYPSKAYFHTFSNVRYLMAGCFGALIYSGNESKINKFLTVQFNYFYFVVLTILLLIFSSHYFSWIASISLFLFPILYLYVVVFHISQSNSSNQTIFSKLGKYTYGMYLYHPIIIIFTKIAFDLMGINYHKNLIAIIGIFIISLIITIIVAYYSYELFEKKILKFKNKFAIVKTRI